jgi:hypothetical protein
VIIRAIYLLFLPLFLAFFEDFFAVFFAFFFAAIVFLFFVLRNLPLDCRLLNRSKFLFFFNYRVFCGENLWITFVRRIFPNACSFKNISSAKNSPRSPAPRRPICHSAGEPGSAARRSWEF